MAYKYSSRRSTRRIARKSKRNFIISLILIALLIYSTIAWILPSFINGLGFIKNIFKPSQKISSKIEDSTLAPPVLNIPYEATNTAQITISGYSTPKSNIVIYVDDEIKGTTEALEDGRFEITDVQLSLGTNNIYGKTKDEKMESLPSKTIRIIFDNEKPILNINEPEDGKKIQGGDKKVKVSGQTEAGAFIFINGNQAVVDKDGNFTSEQTLNDGDNIFTIKAQDSASNITEIQRRVNYTP